MKFKIIRHLEEVETFEMNRDGDIDPSQIDLLINHYTPSILTSICSKDYDQITIISSDKLRSIKTTDILIRELRKNTQIQIEHIQDGRATAEVHGIYRAGTDLKHPAVKKAKFAYIREVFERNNVWYRHGSINSVDGPGYYPELAEVFTSLGENQIELNIRMYQFHIRLD